MEVFKRLQPEEFIKQHIEQGVRVDGRQNLELFRPISVTSGSIASADGSSIVKKGNTIISCGIKLELADASESKDGNILVVPNVELPPMCHSKFRPGPPGTEAQNASIFLKEVLSNSKCLPEIKIEDGSKLIWVIYLDLICLNHDGNLHDAVVTASVSALKNLKIPSVNITSDIDGGDDVIKVDTESTRVMKLNSEPVSVTTGIINGQIIVDPTFEEESFCESLLTVVMDENNDIIHYYKPGGIGMDNDSLEKCFNIAKKQAKNVRTLVDKSNKMKF